MKPLLACFAACIVAAAAHAQAPYPNKPIRLIAPFPPGAVVDTLCRTIAVPMGELLGQPVVVENRTGAGGNIGMDLVAKAPADGYTVGMGGIGTHGINPSVYARMPFDPVRDFVPITFVASNINVLVVNPSVPARDVAELVSYAKANPGKLAFGSAGIGTSQHLAGELFKQVAGIDMAHVPYKGAGPAVSDLIAGQIPLMFADISAALGHIRSGRLRALGVTTRERTPLLDVPTLIEQGVADFDVNAWFGLLAPAGTPPEIIAKLNGAGVKALGAPATRERLQSLGLNPAPGTPEEFARFIRAELDRWSKVARAVNIRAE
ncbi:MAG TPA: tripartite tricarboxylate transporter substrate binding protein [Burkholderiales bacterium]